MKYTKELIYLMALGLAAGGAALWALPEQSGTNDGLNVATAIQSALEKNASLSVSARQIKVTTTDKRELFLQGSVVSAKEHDAVVDLTIPFIGTYKLRDELVVSSINTTGGNALKATLVASR